MEGQKGGQDERREECKGNERYLQEEEQDFVRELRERAASLFIRWGR